MTESPQHFGPDGSLIGVLTLPERDEAAPGERVAVILFNAGVLPRVGPHRFNVKLARAAAGAGLPALRFDLAGQGDSRSAMAGGDYREQAVSDLRAAMDHLEASQGIRRFALIGICSGAVNAYWAALVDPRICGILLFDGYWYRSRWTTLVRHWKRARAASWRAVLRALWRRVPGAMRQAGGGDEPAAGIFDNGAAKDPTAAEFGAAMEELTSRQVSVLLVFSGSVIDYYSYAGQFKDVFAGQPFLSRVQCQFRPDIDHTFLTLDCQRRMIDLTLAWATRLGRGDASSP